MPDRTYELSGVRIFECGTEGQPPRNGRDATDLIGAARSRQAAVAVIPATWLGDDFYRLRTGIAGEIVQKFVMYGLRLAIVGDTSRYATESAALRDFIYECNRGTQIWFLPDLASLENRLAAG